MSIIQTSCSELLVDTAIHDPKEALERFNHLLDVLKWESSPPLTLELLQELKEDAEERLRVVIYDAEGNRAMLQYGDNGYVTTGYRFDSCCNDGDDLCYPIFYEAINKLNGNLIFCDGGTGGGYYDWESRKNETDSG